MKNIFTSLLVFLAGASFVHAQTQGFSCTAGEVTQREYDKHPQLLVAKDKLDAYTKEYIKANRAQSQGQRSAAQYVIPVVFHIQHDGGSEMLPDEQIYLEMLHWNEYMNATDTDLRHTDAAFDTLIGNPQVEFRLAQLDPNGVCTNGIERIYTQSTYYGNNDCKLNPWPPKKYLNVWLTRGIERDITNYGTLAYSMYPSSVATYVNNDIIDGIISKAFVVGSNDQFSRPTMAHECGHWMNLEHVWGNTNAPEKSCGDDEVDDTPITKGNQNNCIHNLSVCTPPIIENEQNIMNYANCHFMFTKGQVERMHAALNSSVAGRSNIWSQANLIATGTQDSIGYPNINSCAKPVADFTVSKRFICTNTSVFFTDASWNASVDNRNWVFPADANVITSTTDPKPEVQFQTPGWKEVSLTVDNNNGSSQKVKTLIYVNDPDAALVTAPFFEGFENANNAQTNWKVLNYDNNNTTFQYLNNVGHHSSACYKLNLYDAAYDGDNDELLSPAYDISQLDLSSDPTVSFDYSFATYEAAHMADSVATIAVYASQDCGTTWKRIYYNLGGFNLYNAGTISNRSYSPGIEDEYWQTVTATIPSAIYQSGNPVNFRFSVTSAKGANNFYIDNINVGAAEVPSGINTIKSTIGFMNVFPNPATQGEATVLLNTTAASAHTTVKMYDMTGREVITIFEGALQAGQRNVTFATENISEGIYTVKVSDGKTSLQKRFIKL